MEDNNTNTTLFWRLFFVALSVLIGIVGFMAIEQYKFLDALYMTVITISTVGYREIHPPTDAGKVFVTLFIIFNLSAFTYLISYFTGNIIEKRFKSLFGINPGDMNIAQLKNHVIVCGFGRNGQKACEELERAGYTSVAIDTHKPPNLVHNHHSKTHFMVGDATDDETLKSMGIAGATAIIITLPKDAENVFITLTAREFNPNIKIISRASEASSMAKLYRAGADKVVMPDAIGGLYMANLITQPDVIGFLDLMNGLGEERYILEEISHNDLQDVYKDCSLADLGILQNPHIVVMGIKDEANKLELKPSPTGKLEAGHVLIIFGTQTEIKKIRAARCK